MKTQYLRIADLMVQAGWLHSHIYTDGKGLHLTWTEAGTERAIILRRIIATFSLKNDDRAAMVFDKLARGERLPDFGRTIELDRVVAAFWIECIDQLGLQGDETGLLVLVHIIEGWTPDLDTPVKFQ